MQNRQPGTRYGCYTSIHWAKVQHYRDQVGMKPHNVSYMFSVWSSNLSDLLSACRLSYALLSKLASLARIKLIPTAKERQRH